MVRCVNCANFKRETMTCHGYDKPIKIKPKDIHKQLPCPRYKLKWGKTKTLVTKSMLKRET